jgi:L-ascorbate metabolism protein UlaG (beta-lactamase superfamily)
MSDLTLRFLGQSGFEISKESSTIIIDPSNKKSGQLKGDLVYCTHVHFDHVGGVKPFLEFNPDAVLVGNSQVIEKFPEYSDRSIVVENGDSMERGPWKFEFIKNRHGFFKNVLNLGVIVRTEAFSFGHPGDGVYFKGFYNAGLKYMAIPIVGGFAASPKRALTELIKFADPKPMIIPIHWVFRNPNSFCHKLSTRIDGITCKVPEIGQRVV